MEEQIVVNVMITPDGTILVSKHRHDYQSHIDKNGETYFIDGGRDYIRCSKNEEQPTFIQYTVSDMNDSDKWLDMRKYIYRGTFDKEGNRIWKSLDTMSNTHLKNCIIYNENRGFGNSVSSMAYKKELEYRQEHNIIIEDDYQDGDE